MNSLIPEHLILFMFIDDGFEIAVEFPRQARGSVNFKTTVPAHWAAQAPPLERSPSSMSAKGSPASSSVLFDADSDSSHMT